MKLDDFLHGKPMFYKQIDYTRMPRAWSSIRGLLANFKIIHIIGTNGKGSTGRFLSQILRAQGFSVGHYTSPHIFEFSERFWLDGKVISASELERAHERLLEILPQEFVIKTSYFEYATLLAAVVFERCDYFVCEAGMGGELDATNVFDKALSVFTPIGFDHIDTLGNSLEAISKTKFSAMSSDAKALLSDVMDPRCVDIARDIAQKKGVDISFASQNLCAKELQSIARYTDRFDLADFLRSNLTLSCAAAKILLNHDVSVDDLGALDISGRCERIEPNVYVDVGHNELGAQVIAQKFQGKKLTFIYNAFADKDFGAVLRTLKPIISRVLIFDYPSPTGRELGGEAIAKTLEELNIKHEKFISLTRQQARNSDEIFLAFGSFYLVEAFLRQFDASQGL